MENKKKIETVETPEQMEEGVDTCPRCHKPLGYRGVHSDRKITVFDICNWLADYFEDKIDFVLADVKKLIETGEMTDLHREYLDFFFVMCGKFIEMRDKQFKKDAEQGYPDLFEV